MTASVNHLRGGPDINLPSPLIELARLGKYTVEEPDRFVATSGAIRVEMTGTGFVHSPTGNPTLVGGTVATLELSLNGEAVLFVEGLTTSADGLSAYVADAANFNLAPGLANFLGNDGMVATGPAEWDILLGSVGDDIIGPVDNEVGGFDEIVGSPGTDSFVFDSGVTGYSSLNYVDFQQQL